MLWQWDQIYVKPNDPSLPSRRPMPIFYAPSTFKAIPLVAKSGGLPFLVLVTSPEQQAQVSALLRDFGVNPLQYEIRENPNIDEAVGKAVGEYPDRDPFVVHPMPGWLDQLLEVLKSQGVEPVERGGVGQPLSNSRLEQVLAATDPYLNSLL
jgi:hypothetical protein